MKLVFALSVTTEPFSAKFLKEQGNKNHQYNAGHTTKMAAMPISGEKTLKIFFPGNTVLILMNLCMKHQRPKPFIFCSNYDPGLNLTYLWHSQILQLRFLDGKCDNDGLF